MMWSSCSDGNILGLSLEQQWIPVNNDRVHSLQLSACYPRQAMSHSAFLPATMEVSPQLLILHFRSSLQLPFEGWGMWISPPFSDCWLVILNAYGCILQSPPFIFSWLQVRPVTTLDILAISNADWFWWVIPTCLQEVLHLISGAFFLLLSDDIAPELFSVIMVIVLVWERFQMGNLKPIECGLERIIDADAAYDSVPHVHRQK